MGSKLKIIGPKGIDILYLLFYTTLVVGFYFGFIYPVMVSLLITVRDHFTVDSRTQELLKRIEEIESDLTNIKMQQGIKVLK